MKIVRVQYQVKEEYVAQNKANIEKVMQALRDQRVDGMTYSSYYLGDGRFMHLNHIREASAQEALSNLQEFNDFRMALKASGPIQPPQSEELDMVGVNRDAF